MVPPLDPFAQAFDSIEIDPARTPSPAAIDHANALFAHEPPQSAEPGFYLLDNANGRFVVDRQMGVVTLADESLLRSERNTIHAVTLRVIEPSGVSYELEMRLRISGRVPQMIGAEEFGAIAGLTDETILVAPRVPVLVTPQETAPPIAAPIEETPAAATPWTHFAVAQGHSCRTPRVQPRRSFITAELPTISEPISMRFDGLPAGFAAHLPWSL
ncbi:MAG: hypothetical protein JNL81_14830 [Hyphomonadaceae bacterium]|nr:hypothetical protein [Hyphomonadaceae bacterium]